ncbi:MAG TPA: metal-sensitive transcriptional regulator [bacterium]|jgi:CsoR family transcriptional regulator, copper-sensing transcriptional repressor|nr:metal-sensitive transcriptional regulator [bacterium]
MARTVVGFDPRAKEKILARLRSVEGHLRGITRMVEEDQYCVDVIKQTKAVQSAIDRVNALLLERHLNHCVSAAIKSDDARERERVVSELLDVFENGQG